MTTQTFLPYAHQSIGAQDLDAVQTALQADWITRGPLVEKFEKEFATFCGAQYAVAFSSGSAALSAAYYAAQIDPFDRVITTPNTFIATLGTAVRFGALPIFVDTRLQHGRYQFRTADSDGERTLFARQAFCSPCSFFGHCCRHAKIGWLVDQSGGDCDRRCCACHRDLFTPKMALESGRVLGVI